MVEILSRKKLLKELANDWSDEASGKERWFDLPVSWLTTVKRRLVLLEDSVTSRLMWLSLALLRCCLY